MKIALVSPYDFPYPGGVTEHIIGLANAARSRRHEVHILAACSGYQNKTFPNTRVITRHVTPVSIGGAVARVGLSPRSYGPLKKILKREAFDVIHLHEPLTPGMTWLALMQACILPQTVTIGTFHAYHERPNWFYASARPLFRKFFAKLDALIAVSQAARDFAYRMFPGDYRIIPNGVDLRRFSQPATSRLDPDPASADNTVTILFVGRLDKRKGFWHLFDAFITLKHNDPRLRLKVVGPFEPKDLGPYRQFARTAKATGIEFVAYVSPERLPKIYHQADIFCAPSVGFESFGIVLLEAMAAGLPIVASDIVGYRSILTHGQEGLLVPPGQSGCLAQALHQLINNPHQRQMMGQQGQLKASQFSWDRIVDRVLEVYLTTIHRKTRANLKSLDYANSDIYLEQRQANPEGKSC